MTRKIEQHQVSSAAGQPTVIATMGDPLGIGPEILVKALADEELRGRARYVIFGSEEPMVRGADRAGIHPYWATLAEDTCEREVEAALARAQVVLVAAPFVQSDVQSAPKDSAEGGQASFLYVERAIEYVKSTSARARRSVLVTGPISKKSWDLARQRASADESEMYEGKRYYVGPFPGHTELLGERFGSSRCSMLFVGPTLRVMLATIHVPLGKVSAMLTEKRVLDAIEMAHEACVEMGAGDLAAGGGVSPRIAVLGLNPHAGEQGLLGSEDREVIEPAIAAARGKGIEAFGPMSADTLYSRALLRDGKRVRADGFDCVVAMYHDQGLIPVKLVDPHATVNVTTGLQWAGRRVVRTSPAHGTAFDIAGKNMADERAMKSAIEMGIGMAE